MKTLIVLALAAALAACDRSLPYEPKPACEPGATSLVADSTALQPDGTFTVRWLVQVCGWPKVKP